MQQHKHTLTYGFAIFAMFFGSGNLVFPIQIGQSSGQHWLAGFLGLCITGIILPFLGLYVIKLYNGSYKLFFGEAGKYAKIALPFFTLSLLGCRLRRCELQYYRDLKKVASVAFDFNDTNLN